MAWLLLPHAFLWLPHISVYKTNNEVYLTLFMPPPTESYLNSPITLKKHLHYSSLVSASSYRIWCRYSGIGSGQFGSHNIFKIPIKHLHYSMHILKPYSYPRHLYLMSISEEPLPSVFNFSPTKVPKTHGRLGKNI